MKIVVAPNQYKGSLSAGKAAKAMAAGIRRVLTGTDIEQVPVADGGDGLVDIALEVLQGESRKLLVTGPRFDLVEAEFCHVPQKAFAAIEMARASGLALMPDENHNPLETTTLGTGELIRAALELGVESIAVGIGGSATNDGGIGMATALGVRFLDSSGQPVRPVGGALETVARIDMSGLDERIGNIHIEAVCDVANPLLGEQGATRVYGPQKGADPVMVEQLESGMTHLARVIRADLGLDIAEVPGGGAAGGLGAGLHAFLGAELRRGVDVVLDMVGLDEKLEGADLVLTGEGQIDFQTVFGKAPVGVAQRAKKQKIPCIVLAGSVGEDLGDLRNQGVDAVFSLCSRPISLKEAMEQAETDIIRTTEQVVRCFLAGQQSVRSTK